MAIVMAYVAVPKSNGGNANWTAIYAAGGTITVFVQNVGGTDLLIRGDASAAANEALTVAAELLRPGEGRSYSLVSGDDLVARPFGDIENQTPGRVVVRTP